METGAAPAFPAARVRVKICGLRSGHDVDAAIAAGTDAIGFVFYAPSKRAIDPEVAARLRCRIPAFVSVVALFVDPHPELVQQVLDRVQPDLLQFHGDESPDYCASFGRPYMKAFRVGGGALSTADQVLACCQPYQGASAWLFDAYSTAYGGSGLTFDPALLASVQSLAARPALVLAGGLKPDTVGDAIVRVRPYAVDVSSGVEDAPGIKNYAKMLSFVWAAGNFQGA